MLSIPAADAIATMDALADQVALVNGTLEVPVAFDAPYAQPYGVTESAAPTITHATALWAAAQGDVVDLGATRYTVVGVEPNPAAGLTVCRLNRE